MGLLTSSAGVRPGRSINLVSMEFLITPCSWQAIPIIVQVANPNFNFYLPADTLLKFISTSKSSLLALRLVNRTTRDWVDEHLGKMFEKIFWTYPPLYRSPAATPKDLEHVHKIGGRVHHLYISVLPSTTTCILSDRQQLRTLFQSLPSLTHITLSLKPAMSSDTTATEPWRWPSSDPDSTPLLNHHHPLLAIRCILESSELVDLHSLTLSPISIAGIMSLRSGPFSTFLPPHPGAYYEADGSFERSFWKQIRVLEIALVRWWDVDTDVAILRPRPPQRIALRHSERRNRTVPPQYKAQYGDGTDTLDFANRPENQNPVQIQLHQPHKHRKRPPKPYRNSHYKMGAKVFHDFLATFSATVQTLRFSWFVIPTPLSTILDLSQDLCEDHETMFDNYKPLAPVRALPYAQHPNPLLFHAPSAALLDFKNNAWFSMPPHKWRALRVLIIDQSVASDDKDRVELQKIAKKLLGYYKESL